MNITKKTVLEYIQDKGFNELTNEKLIECFLVLNSTSLPSHHAVALHDEMKRREICFSEFYHFAKFKWSSRYLANLAGNSSPEVKEFVEGFHKHNSSYSKTSAPRQKGGLVARLYALFYERYRIKDLTIIDAQNLFDLIMSNYDAFKGNRDDSENALTRKDLYGLVAFLRTLYELNGVDVPNTILEQMIPDELIKSKGRAISRGKVKSLGRQEQLKAYSLLVDIHQSYVDTLLLKTQKEQNSAFYNLLDYVEKILRIECIHNVDELSELLVQGRQGSQRFLHYLENVVRTTVRGKSMYIRDMMVWAMNEYDIGYEYGFEPLFNHFEWDRIQRDKVFKKIKGTGKDETPKAVIPMRVHQIAIDILCDSEYTWAKSLEDQYFEDEQGCRVFNPTLNNLLALIFQLPLRTIQAQVLDSGEGDEYRYDFDSLLWQPNNSPHTGYWKSMYAINADRGFIKRDQSLVREAKLAKCIDDNGNPIIRQAYMYINTNKTQDRSVGFSEVSGYTIPWHHEEAIAIYARQLEFIKKHHPVTSPADMKDLERPQTILGGKPTKAVLDIIPKRFYLFRCSLNSDENCRDFPPTKALITKMWNHLMVEVQRRLDAEGADYSVVSDAKLEKYLKNIGGGNSYISYLTPHCTRVTGITRLEEFGVPIHIISKLIAGHANVRTTYRYTKHDKTYVNDRITEAQAQISSTMELALTDELKTSDIEQARQIAYIPDIYLTSWKDVQERSWNSNALGICPNSGTLCDEGRDEGAVEFSGAGKCLNCKYLISGKPFLINIWAHVNSLLYKAKELNDDYSILQSDYKMLLKSRKSEYKENGKSVEWANINKMVKKAENSMEMNSGGVNLILSEVYYGNLLFETVRGLTNTKEDFVESIGFEDCTDFQHLNAVVESESYLPYFERDKNLKFKRDTFVDKALVAIGEQPIFLRNLSSEEKEQTISGIATLIENDIKAQEGKFLGATLKLEDLTGTSHAA
ncbi:VPA1269 family protein [Vibrio crassostreae]|uniref:VPA1269 family protein n=1 Tax=Vibrio crassostreae TaxID=246167 RepID=UPI001B30C00F|nr:VPA1269 family protein [Vibrio crassostreae]